MQWMIINNGLPGDLQVIREAFEDFGQGVPYDDARALKLHNIALQWNASSMQDIKYRMPP
jgi:hypothetical protein